MEASTHRPVHRIQNLLGAAPWAMLPSAFELMCEIVERRMAGLDLSRAEKDAAIEAAARPTMPASAPGSIVIIPLMGTISPRASMMDDVSSCGTSLEAFCRRFQAAIDDPNVAAVIIDVHSCGGSVYLVEETARVVARAKGVKPVYAVANAIAASAAYWIASQAEVLYCSPSAEVGSIGVVMRLDNLAKAAEMAGVSVRYMTAPQDGHKAEGNPFEDLDPDTAAYMQKRLDAYYNPFVRDVAKGTGLSVAQVRSEECGRGRVLGAADALSAGLVARIGTIGDAIADLVKLGKTGGARAVVIGGVVNAEAAVVDLGAERAQVEIEAAHAATAEATAPNDDVASAAEPEPKKQGDDPAQDDDDPPVTLPDELDEEEEDDEECEKEASAEAGPALASEGQAALRRARFRLMKIGR